MSVSLEKSNRVVSIDVFRGLTILVMIFVNDVASVSNIPGWLKHFPPEGNGMTFVDLVFPAFLFIVGMSIPLAVRKRIGKGDSTLTILKHILIRTLGLIIIGVLMVNMGRLNSEITGMSKSLWMLLVFLSVILVWNSYETKNRYAYILRGTGIFVIIFLAVIYRGGPAENITWLQTSWWGILGLIGWTYITSCIVYFLFRNHIAGMAGVLFFFISLYIGERTGAIDFLSGVNEVLWLGGHIGGHTAIATAGMIVSMVFTSSDYLKTDKEKITWTLVFALILFLTGFMLYPLYGINKNMATPAWDLYCSAICAVLFVLLYFVIDMKGYKRWTFVFSPTGSNPLLAYILPDIFYAILGLLHITFIGVYLSDGILGILRSIIITALMVILTSFLTKKKVRLHL
ncbi:MAG TPA: DUF5009 domain-containing protein [Ignavibacteriaceae bacterium]|nr:DUF5009 domain-containing protein [Ignavibacteriaceae bacterium]